jgi:acyl carrier protein
VVYRTGDLGRYRPDGLLEILGRLDHQVKIRGVRVEPDEVSAVLLAHPMVRAAVVVACRDERGENYLAAYVVAPGGEGLSRELRKYLGEQLPAAAVPGALVFLESLPLLPNGKVDRRALPAVERVEPPRRGACLAPWTATQERLAEIWQQVLRLEQVGVRDNFFELGGHSLVATQVMSRCREAFGVELPVRSLFESPTVEELSRRVDEARREVEAGGEGPGVSGPPLVRVPRRGKLPLSFSQERLWFFDQMEPGNSAYNLAFALSLSGPLNVGLLWASLRELERRHESLRTVFCDEQGEPCQVIQLPGRKRVGRSTWRGVPCGVCT